MVQDETQWFENDTFPTPAMGHTNTLGNHGLYRRLKQETESAKSQLSLPSPALSLPLLVSTCHVASICSYQHREPCPVRKHCLISPKLLE